LDNEDDLKFIEKAFDWTLELDGRAWVDGKCFLLLTDSNPWLTISLTGKNYK
jgi:hypothetical protein